MMNNVFVYLELKKELLEGNKQENRLANYFEAIDKGETEKYWDRRNVAKNKMSWKDFKNKWYGKNMRKTETITITEDSAYTCKSEQDMVICPNCMATNTVSDRKCRNCEYPIKKEGF